MVNLMFFSAIDLFTAKEKKLHNYSTLFQSIDTFRSGLFAFTLYPQRAQFISLLPQTVCTRANTFLAGVDIFIVKG